METTTIIYICGFYNILLAIFHTLFWKIFKWNETLDKGTKATKIITQIMNIQLIYLFLFMAFIYLFYAEELLKSKIGNAILIGYAGFWIVRFFQQFIFLKQKGKFVIGLTILFLIGAIIHLIPISI
ncbi:MAG: hypothetical protein L3J14_03650 [Flavobacteriaceae bacterium]|nr:hypothetical protein [Flavobacteriaceae bacterium]